MALLIFFFLNLLFQADYVDFGGKRVPRDKLDEISHRKVSILAAELCVLLYTPREMALCSLSGKKSNAHRTSFPKKPLDPNRLEAIIGKFQFLTCFSMFALLALYAICTVS